MKVIGLLDFKTLYSYSILWPTDMENQSLEKITDSMDMNLSKLWETVKDREVWHAIVHGVRRVRHDLVPEQQLL